MKKYKREKDNSLSFNLEIEDKFVISPKKKKVNQEINKIMNPAFLLGTAFNIAY